MFHATIIGLPRSRTFWFSHFLTHGDYHCFHDYESYIYPEVKGKILLNSTPNALSKPVGNTVIIERDWREAMRSMQRFLVLPYNVQDLANCYMKMAEHLETLEGYRVKYEDINTRLPQILKHLDVQIPLNRLLEGRSFNKQSKDNCEENSEYPYRYTQSCRF